MHDLSQFASGGICFHMDDITVNDGEECDSFRHSTFTSRLFDICQRFNVFNKIKSLRTFLVLPEGAGSACYTSRNVVLYGLVS